MPDMSDLMPTTPDLNRERLDQLKRLMPDLFTADDRLDLEELKRLVDPSMVADSEKFEFRWFGKADAKRRAFTPTTAALQYDVARSVNPEVADGNMIIEGENLEVLKCLLSAYREKIKCIYIDPPYNTGNDFVYRDNYTEQRKAYWEQTGVTEEGVKIDTNTESDGRFHSNWLNMMYPRLLAARQLLREDGVIFISIDDHEVHHLRKLCDEVFGADSFIAKFIWEKRTNRENRKVISTRHDYIICYCKSITPGVKPIKQQPMSEKALSNYRNPDNDPRGLWKSDPATAQAGHGTKSQFYVLEAPNGKQHKLESGRCWLYTNDVMQEAIDDNRIWFGKDGNGVPRIKTYLNSKERGLTPETIWFAEDVSTTENSKNQLKELFDGASVFETPKPVDLLKLAIQVSTDDDIVLDFFSGSGPTGQAVMELNNEVGSNRKFILVQLPELTDEHSEAYKAGYKKISDITIERNKRVIARIEQEQAEKQQQGLFEEDHAPYKPGFKIYRLVKSHFPRVEFQPDPEKTAEENIALLRQYIVDKEATLYSLFNEADIFDEVMLKNGFQLHYTREPLPEFSANSVYRVSDGHKTALVCLDGELKNATVAALNGRDEIFICLERAVDTTKKWNLKHMLGEKLVAF